jgi:hypothetical protein
MNIIAQLQGGLGNQLFQYATARALAHERQSPVLLDQSWFTKFHQDVTPRESLLSKLNIKGELITLDPAMKKPNRIRKILQRLWPVNPYFYAEKFHYKFDEHLKRAPTFKAQHLYLMGYWQSYRYFDYIKKILQTEISPKNPLDLHYQDYVDQIESTNSAMVHVRRGDYVSLESAIKIHGFIGLEYYQQGMELLLQKNSNTHFFVFSDDLAWAKEHLPHQDKITFIESLDCMDSAVQELALMTKCQYHLIANSSLSWWGAWLAQNEKGVVICPKRWTNDQHMVWDDLLPPHWQRI